MLTHLKPWLAPYVGEKGNRMLSKGQLCPTIFTKTLGNTITFNFSKRKLSPTKIFFSKVAQVIK